MPFAWQPAFTLTPTHSNISCRNITFYLRFLFTPAISGTEFGRKTRVWYVENKGQLDATIWIFIAKLTVRSACFGHHYAHHQELKNYTDGCCLWYMALWFTGRWSGVEL
jgi:hypothetical protein